MKNYPAGGYIVQLGRNKYNTRLALNYIKSTRWIDELTRAIFIEVSFYNANQNLFTIVTLVVEKSATGKYITTYIVSSKSKMFLFR